MPSASMGKERRTRSPSPGGSKAKRHRRGIGAHAGAPAQQENGVQAPGPSTAQLAAFKQQLDAERAARAAAETKASFLSDKLKCVGARSKERGTMVARMLAAVTRVEACKQHLGVAQRNLADAEGQLQEVVDAATAMMQDEHVRQQQAMQQVPAAAARTPLGALQQVGLPPLPAMTPTAVAAALQLAGQALSSGAAAAAQQLGHGSAAVGTPRSGAAKGSSAGHQPDASASHGHDQVAHNDEQHMDMQAGWQQDAAQAQAPAPAAMQGIRFKLKV